MEFFFIKTKNAPEDEIEYGIRAVEAAFGIAITVHDLHGRMRQDNGDPLLPGRHLHRHPCCLRDRFQEKEWNSRCYRDCYSHAEMVAGKEARPYIKTCWKGLQELVVPITYNSQHLLTLYAGVFRSTEAPPHGSPDKKWFSASYAELPTIGDENTLESLYNALEILGNGIVAIGLRPKSSDRPYTARAATLTGYITDNAHRRITLSDLARHLHLSPSRTAHLTVELTGKTFQELLIQERMARARNLLLSTDQKLGEVSAAAGFKNEYYFNRAFKQYFGKTPGRFRRDMEAGRQ